MAWTVYYESLPIWCPMNESILLPAVVSPTENLEQSDTCNDKKMEQAIQVQILAGGPGWMHWSIAKIS